VTEPRRLPSGRQPRSFRHESCGRGGGGSGTVADRTESGGECDVGDRKIPFYYRPCVRVYYDIIIYLYIKTVEGFKDPMMWEWAKRGGSAAREDNRMREYKDIGIGRYTVALVAEDAFYAVATIRVQLIRRRIICPARMAKNLYTRVKSPQRKRLEPTSENRWKRR